MEYNKKINNTSKSKLQTTKNNYKCTTSHTRIQPQQLEYYSSANTQLRLQNNINNNNNNSKIEINASSPDVMNKQKGKRIRIIK